MVSPFFKKLSTTTKGTINEETTEQSSNKETLEEAGDGIESVGCLPGVWEAPYLTHYTSLKPQHLGSTHRWIKGASSATQLSLRQLRLETLSLKTKSISGDAGQWDLDGLGCNALCDPG